MEYFIHESEISMLPAPPDFAIKWETPLGQSHYEVTFRLQYLYNFWYFLHFQAEINDREQILFQKKFLEIKEMLKYLNVKNHKITIRV